MFQYILPNSLLTGKPQKLHIVQAVHKIWHLLIMGIEKLNFKNDSHLQTSLSNLIDKWLPHFKMVSISDLVIYNIYIRLVLNPFADTSAFFCTNLTGLLVRLVRERIKIKKIKFTRNIL